MIKHYFTLIYYLKMAHDFLIVKAINNFLMILQKSMKLKGIMKML